MQHYFSTQPQSASRPGRVSFSYRGCDVALDTDSGVFSRTELDRGTWELLSALPQELSGDLLDMGCGYGPIGVAAGRRWPGLSVTMADVNPRACALAEQNAQKNGVPARTLVGDGYETLEGERFDWILQNPPIRAGKAVMYRLFAQAAAHLKPGGQLWLVMRKQQGAASAMTYLATLFGAVDCTAKKGGYWVLRCQTPLKDESKGQGA